MAEFPKTANMAETVREGVKALQKTVTLSESAQQCSLIQASSIVEFASRDRLHAKNRVAHIATTWAGGKMIEDAIPIGEAGDIGWGLRGGAGQKTSR